MKNFMRTLAILFFSLSMVLPFQVVQAKGLEDGPIFGKNFTLNSGKSLKEDLIVFGGSVSIEKDAIVEGAIVLFGGSLALDGEITKDVLVLGGAVKLGSETHIRGNLVTFGSAVSRDLGAKIDGDIINNPSRPDIPNFSTNPQVISSSSNPFLKVFSLIGESIMLALLAMIITMFLPIHMRRVADGVVAQPLISFGLGLLTLIMLIVAMVALVLFSFLIITLLITMPLIAIISIVFAAAVVLGWLAMGMEVGVRISRMFTRDWPLPLSAGLGVFSLNLVAQGVGFIPCIGGVISAIVGIAGLGAVLMTRFGTKQSESNVKIDPASEIPPLSGT